MSTETLRQAVIDELMNALGSGNRVTKQRLEKIEHGNLDHASARYVLHRLFVQRHGMHLKGLSPGGDSWRDVSPTELLEDKVPGYVQSLFEERLGGQGLSLHELTILAATLEHLIHDEAVDRLQAIYKAHELDPADSVKLSQVDKLIESYMQVF